MNALFHAHSGLRYLVLTAAVVAIGYLLIGIFRGRPLDRGSRILAALFTGLLDLQIVFGLVLLLAYPLRGARIGHAVAMVLAAVVAHVVSVMNKRRPEEQRSPVLALSGVLLPLGLVVSGIIALGRAVV